MKKFEFPAPSSSGSSGGSVLPSRGERSSVLLPANPLGASATAPITGGRATISGEGERREKRRSEKR